MKVFVAGATGRVGQDLVHDLVAQGHEVVAAARHPEKMAQDHVTPLAFDFHSSVDAMEEAVRGCDAVFFTAGSRGKDLLQTDAFGAVKLMQACEKAGVKRFVMLSSMFALQPKRWASEEGISDITDYNIAKLFADAWLINDTKLDYTIVQAGILAEEAPTGKIEVDPPHEGKVPIPDVASVLAASLAHPSTIGKTIMVRGGTTPIDEALESL